MPHLVRVPQSEYLSVAMAAKLLNESRWTTRRRIESGQLPATKLGPNTAQYVIHVADVDALIADRKAGAA